MRLAQAVRSTWQVVCGVALFACGQMHPRDSGPDAADAGEEPVDGGDAGLVDGGRTDAGPVVDGGPAVDGRAHAFCVELNELRCQGNEACCGLADRVALDWFTACDAASIGEDCERWAADSALGDGSVQWNDVEARGLLIDLAAAMTTCARLSRPFDLSPVFEGTLDVGATCTPDLPYGRSIGQYRCQEGLRCALDGSEASFTGVCLPLGGEGDSCNFDCDEGLWCDDSLAGGDVAYRGRCAREERTGLCGRDSWCRSRFCDLDTFSCRDPTSAETWCGFEG